ncbi:MAG: Asp-tRNA(Asn)/Glu-tRNA(Gln) amidotransferase subunit GatC [Candidatus Micrarchaeota archaeon]|nr:Asp-tRNA(Asn)/Glu-tRNA(Gln) amidotransferase subunit GatC [Candidatus Micrarchaeota archaeon]
MEDREFDRLLKLCRLSLTDKEKSSIKKEIGSILGYFDAIEQVKCDELDPSYHPVKVPERLRDDKVEACENPDALLKGTRTHRFYVIGPDV